MAEYIEREAAIKEIGNDSPEQVGYSREDAADCIRYMQAADVAPVRHGRWIEESDGGTRCSVCNKRVRDATGGRDDPVNLSKMPYCPKCGAKMDLDGGTKNGRP